MNRDYTYRKKKTYRIIHSSVYNFLKVSFLISKQPYICNFMVDLRYQLNFCLCIDFSNWSSRDCFLVIRVKILEKNSLCLYMLSNAPHWYIAARDLLIEKSIYEQFDLIRRHRRGHNSYVWCHISSRSNVKRMWAGMCTAGEILSVSIFLSNYLVLRMFSS